MVSERRHALAFDDLYRPCRAVSLGQEISGVGALTRRDWISRENIDGHPPVIEMLNVDNTASKSRQQVDFSMVE
jgi:hypothetical protein